jgi:uncharacterized protein with GYD domain
MPTYILLGGYTEKGVATMKESPQRLDGARKLAKSLGAKLTDFYLTMGGPDFVVMLEAPDDETVAKFVLNAAAKGAVRTTTLKAFSEKEYRKLCASLK